MLSFPGLGCRSLRLAHRNVARASMRRMHPGGRHVGPKSCACMDTCTCMRFVMPAWQHCCTTSIDASLCCTACCSSGAVTIEGPAFVWTPRFVLIMLTSSPVLASLHCWRHSFGHQVCFHDYRGVEVANWPNLAVLASFCQCQGSCLVSCHVDCVHSMLCMWWICRWLVCVAL